MVITLGGVAKVAWLRGSALVLIIVVALHRPRLILRVLWTGKTSRYVTSHLGQLSLPSLQGRLVECQPFWLCWVAGNIL